MDRIRQKTAGTYALNVATRDDDGIAVTASSPASLVVVDGAGANSHTYTPTIAAGEMTQTAPVADMPYLDTYVGTWTDNAGLQWSSRTEICGGFLFEIADFRLLDTKYADAGVYSAALLRAVRTTVEMRCEEVAGVAFVPRARRLRVIGDGSTRLLLSDPALRSVREVKIDGVAMTAGELADITLREWGALDRTDGSVWTEHAAIDVWYEHGLDCVPEPVTQAAMLAAPEYLTRKALASRAVTEVTEFGTFNLSIAGYRKPFGIPEVDRVLSDFGRSARLIG